MANLNRRLPPALRSPQQRLQELERTVGYLRDRLGSATSVVRASAATGFAQLRASLVEGAVTFTDGTPPWTFLLGLTSSSDQTTLATSGDLSLEPATDTVLVNHTTTGASANAVLDGTTRALARSTSSLRYKQDVEDLELDLRAVLAIRPRTWRDRGEVEADPNTTKRYVGAIAEELDELGGGLEQFVVYDQEGRPDAIAYDRITVALVAVVRHLSDQVADLEGH